MRFSLSSTVLNHFYPRSPCGERHEALAGYRRRLDISIHALLAESDGSLFAISAVDNRISIHALLAESDPVIHCLYTAILYFYPRSPCGERPLLLPA